MVVLCRQHSIVAQSFEQLTGLLYQIFLRVTGSLTVLRSIFVVRFICLHVFCIFSRAIRLTLFTILKNDAVKKLSQTHKFCESGVPIFN